MPTFSIRCTKMQTFSAKMQVFSKKRKKETTGLVLRRPVAFCFNPYQGDKILNFDRNRF